MSSVSCVFGCRVELFLLAMAKRSSWWVQSWWEHDFDYSSFKFRKLNRHHPEPDVPAAMAAVPQDPPQDAAPDPPQGEQHDAVVMDIDM